jgi:hypothetical protein
MVETIGLAACVAAQSGGLGGLRMLLSVISFFYIQI